MAGFNTLISDEIKKTLNKRIKWAGMEFETESWNKDFLDWNAKTPWVKLISNVLIDESSELAKEYILMGSPLNKDDQSLLGGMDMYSSKESEWPYRPKPIITSVDISSMGDLGSLKKINIDISCFTLEDLDNLEKLYMIPGCSFVLQWGWSNTLGLSSVLQYDSAEITNGFEYKKLKELVEKSEGNYEVVLGIVTNYEWSLQENGGFNIKISALSKGNEVFYIKLKDTVDKKGNTIKAYFENQWKIDIKNEKYGISHIQESEDSWMTLKKLEDEFLPKFLQEVMIGEDNAKKKNFIGGFRSTDESTDKDENSVLIGNHPYLRSMDEKIFMINDTFATDDEYKGKLREIWIHTDVIKDAFLNATNIKGALEAIINKLNTYSLDYWKLRLQAPADEGTGKIIDTNYVETSVQDLLNKDMAIFEFPVNKYNSICRNVSFSSKLPNEFKAMAMMSLHSVSNNEMSNGIIGMWPKVADRYLTYNKEKIEKSTEQIKSENKATAKKETKKEEDLKKVEEEFKKSNIVHTIDKQYWDAWRTQLIKPPKNENAKNNQLTNNRIIPLELSFVLDGISGIYWGNVFTIDYLPESYREGKILFMVKEVKHTINEKEWYTDITGIMRLP